MRRTLFVMALCSVLAAGCGGSSRYLQRGVERYERTDYRGALKQWNELNGSEGSMNDQVLTRYLVYRGLTHYHLGQRSLALIFLTRGKEVYANVSPATLRASMVEEMNKALADVNQLVTPKAKADPEAAKKAEPASPPPAETAAPAAPPSATGEALVPTKAPAKTPAKAPPAKTAAASAGPAPAKSASPASGKPATPAPAKTPQPPTRTSPAVQSTSPK